MGKRERSRKLNPDLGLLDVVGRGNWEGKTKEKLKLLKGAKEVEKNQFLFKE